MTTALRMPDPFSPGAINPTAATPTCCCCCCCCLAATIVTPVALFTSLSRETAPHPDEPAPVDPAADGTVSTGRRGAGLTGVVLAWVGLLAGAVALVPDAAGNRWYLFGVLAVLAAVVATGFARLIGVPSPWTTGVWLLIGAVAFAVEFVVAYLLVVNGGAALYFTVAGPVLGVGLWLVRRRRPRKDVR